MVKKEKKCHFGRDITPAIRAIFEDACRPLPSFFLVEVDGAELGEDETALARTAAAVLSVAEQARFQTFRFPRRRREWLAGRLAVKEAVRALLGRGHWALTALEIGVAASGKPFLVAAAGQEWPVHIAISHSGNKALGLASLAPCALDFQEIRTSLARVEARFAREEEARRIQPSHPDRLTALGLLWAAKEALRKYVELWPLLGFLESGLRVVVPQAGGFLLSFQPVVEKRELPASLPMVRALVHDANALAIILADDDGP